MIRKRALTPGLSARFAPGLAGAAVAAANTVSTTPAPAFVSHRRADDRATHDINDDRGGDTTCLHRPSSCDREPHCNGTIAGPSRLPRRASIPRRLR